jgi:hypothetical protein
MQLLIGTSSLHDALIADGFCYLLHAQCTVQIEIYYSATSFEMYVNTCEANQPHAPLRWEHERKDVHPACQVLPGYKTHCSSLVWTATTPSIPFTISLGPE